ncbi:MAG: hypothetical protein FWH26_11310 [Oscillospiraceae bacterium]|nr:hypothetical protein [Oscillospiraceae bacterium]
MGKFCSSCGAPVDEAGKYLAPPNTGLLDIAEARRLVAEMWDKYVDVRSFYTNQGLPRDYDAYAAGYDVDYYLVTGPINSIYQLKAETEKAVTAAYAQEHFYCHAIDGDDGPPLYMEERGHLWLSDPGGIGWPEEWDFDTLAIVNQTKNTLTAMADVHITSTDEIERWAITLIKLAEGLRVAALHFGCEPDGAVVCDTPEAPHLWGVTHDGTGASPQFIVEAVIPDSSYEFKGSYHGSGTAILEIQAAKGGDGVWRGADIFDLWEWEGPVVASAITISFPAACISPVSSFRARMTHSYVGQDGALRSVSSVWSDPVAAANASSGEIPEDWWETALLGQWHAMDMVAAGYDERWMFESDGAFVYAPSGMDALGRLLCEYGTWKLEGNQLQLTVQKRIVLVGGTIEDSDEGPYIDGAEIVRESVEPAEIKTLTVGGFANAVYDGEEGCMVSRATAVLGGVTYYDFSSQPDMFDVYYEYADTPGS